MKYFISKFLEREVSSHHLLWFRRIFLIALSMQLLFDMKRFSASIREKPLYNPIPLIEWIAAVRPEPWLYDLLLYSLLAALLLASLGLFNRVLLPLAALLFFGVIGVQLGLDKSAESPYVSHTQNLCFFVLLILAVAPAKENKAWPLTLIRLSLGLVYFGSAVVRLKHSGWGWLDGYTLRAYLYEHAYLLDLPHSLWLAGQHELCVFISWLLIIFEFSFVFFVLHPRFSLVFALGGVLFHLSTLYFMQINFLPYHGLVYLIFLVGGMKFDRGEKTAHVQ